MGQMRFLATAPDQLLSDIVDRAYLCGAEHVPWNTRVALQDGVLVVERDVRESGCLCTPWQVEGHGELVLSTTSLMERKQPYHLSVELARGALHRLRAQLAIWQMASLALPDAVTAELRQAQEAFIAAATSQTQVESASRLAQESLTFTLNAMNGAVDAYANASFNARKAHTPKLATLFGAPLDGPLPSAKASKWFLASFNTASVPMTWAASEPALGQFAWDTTETQLAWCREHQLKVIAGPLLLPRRRATPEWLSQFERDFDAMQRHVLQYVEASVRRWQGSVHIWHVAAATNGDGVLRANEEQRLRLTVSAIECVRRLDPRTPIIVSCEQPWGEYMTRRDLDLSPLHFADMLVRLDLGISGLGLEIDFGYRDGTWPRDWIEVNRQIDQWSTLGLPLLVFLTVPSDHTPDSLAAESSRPLPSLGVNGPTPEFQKRWAHRAASLLLAKPTVHAVVWNQLRDEFPHDFAHGGLFDASGHRKPAVEGLAEIRQQHLV